MSGDGQTVVGTNYDGPGGVIEAFAWTSQKGMVGLGHFPNDSGSEGRAASLNGKVAVGYSQFKDVQNAFRWSAQAGLQRLTPQGAPVPAVAAMGISASGNTIVGALGGGFNPEAFVWTQQGGVIGLGHLGGGADRASEACAVSPDGSIVVGGTTNNSHEIVAFRWSTSTGMVGLPLLPGTAAASGTALSIDGSVIVGYCETNPTLTYATRWVNGTPQSLGDLPGGNQNSSAYGCSKDGSIIVGWGHTATGFQAFIWDPINGMRNLREALIAAGLATELQNWTLVSANAISLDGRWVTGYGTSPSGATEAFICSVP